MKPANTFEGRLVFLGIALAFALVYAALEPAAGKVFDELPLPRLWHYLAHFTVFAMMGAVWTLGLPRLKPMRIAMAVIAFGFLHEVSEISGHAHHFELYDAFVDGIGAVSGVVSHRVFIENRAISQASESLQSERSHMSDHRLGRKDNLRSRNEE